MPSCMGECMDLSCLDLSKYSSFIRKDLKVCISVVMQFEYHKLFIYGEVGCGVF